MLPAPDPTANTELSLCNNEFSVTGHVIDVSNELASKFSDLELLQSSMDMLVNLRRANSIDLVPVVHANEDSSHEKIEVVTTDEKEKVDEDSSCKNFQKCELESEPSASSVSKLL